MRAGGRAGVPTRRHAIMRTGPRVHLEAGGRAGVPTRRHAIMRTGPRVHLEAGGRAGVPTRRHACKIGASNTGSGRWTRIEDSWVGEQRVGWWALSRGGEPWRGLLII